MKRRQQVTDRPSIPDRLRQFHVGEWLTERERRTGAPVGDGAALGVQGYRRWKRAQQAWAEETGYTAHEMYRAAQHRGSGS